MILIADHLASSDQDLPAHLLKHGYSLERQFVLTDNGISDHNLAIAAQAVEFVRGSNIEEVLIASDLSFWSELKPVLAALRVVPIPIQLIPFGAVAEVIALPMKKIGDLISAEVQREPLNLVERAIKRAFDIVVATISLILLLPLFVMTAIAINIDSPGPILFRQRRRGFNERDFKIFKFRSMHVLEDGPSIVAASPNDRRVTRLGRWLRKTSIDELPQLINVLIGDMSIVGPRPHAIAHDNQFSKVVQNYAFRHHVKPGITGWAQVNGYRGKIATNAATRKPIEARPLVH